MNINWYIKYVLNVKYFTKTSYNMQKIIIKICLWIFVIGIIVSLISALQKSNKDLEYAMANVKAYQYENSNLKESNIAFQFSINQLYQLQDSLTNKILEVCKDNNIKDRNIKQLQYQLEHFYKKDTIILRDTIFRESVFKLDTCMKDEWSNTCLSLSYPGNIGITSFYKNEKYIIVNSKKEPINPHKCKFINFFRKKHTILEVDVIDKNPYVETREQRFIEIIK